MVLPPRVITWHGLTVAEVVARLDVSHDGLSTEEADARLAVQGPNELTEAPPPSSLATLATQFRSPLIYILLVAAVVTASLGEWTDTCVIGVVLVFNAVIGFTQERKAESSVRGLRTLLAPQARVIRDGHERQIASRDLVTGDVVLLESGVRVPADLRLTHVVGLRIDESLLTGESLPTPKQIDPLPEHAGLGDRSNMAFAGAMTTSGRGRGVVVATGAASQLGEIAQRMRTEEPPLSPLQLRMARLARLIGVIVGVAAAGVFIAGVALGEPVGDMFRFAVAMAVSAIPEGLPVVMTITLAVGVRRMAQRNAIVRRLPAVETLGSTTLIGSDKTGTLTENRMTVMSLFAGGRFWTVDPDDQDTAAAARAPRHPLHRTLLCGVLANEAELYLDDTGVHTLGDPTETALVIAAWRMGLEPEQARDEHDLIAEIPFESERRYSATIHAHGEHQLVCLKGAPERVVELCEAQLADGAVEPLDAAAIHDAAQQMAGEGLRVLAMAERRLPHDDSGDPTGTVETGGLVFLGLQGMFDPPREGVAEAVAGCRSAGIRPIMITGDHRLTAASIATRVGIIEQGGPVLTGSDLDTLTDIELADAVQRVSVFARVSPDHKLRIVHAARSNGDVVAVTGDGVNDAPALKAADIGIAMGRNGTDVAREAADMVLTDDNFASIYAAVHEGRVTFDNIRKVTFFLLSTGAAEIVALFIALVLRWPLLLLPTQILWLNLVTNGVQDVALGFEPAEPDTLTRKPRPSREGVMSKLLWQRTVIVGVVMAAGTLATFRWELDHGGTNDSARTVALTTMVFFQAFHLGNTRSERVSTFRLSPFSNPFLLLASAIALSVHTLALYLPPTQRLLHVEPLGAGSWIRCIAAASTVIAAGEVHKFLVRRRPAVDPENGSHL